MDRESKGQDYTARLLQKALATGNGPKEPDVTRDPSQPGPSHLNQVPTNNDSDADSDGPNLGDLVAIFSNTSFTTGLKTLPTFRPDALVFFRAKISVVPLYSRSAWESGARPDLRPEEDQSIWSKRRQGFQPCCEAGIREPTLSDA